MANGGDGTITLLPVVGLPEIERGADLMLLIAQRQPLRDGDIVVVTSKVVSKCEGAVVDLAGVEPSSFASA
ncbi:MAG: coenzyme F420-0:L-glutamate ligase, partial [Actinomycetota bacterium]|nr:coenzyme F420-0:L-glutamate ligase [Actinomycetota bacterium]